MSVRTNSRPAAKAAASADTRLARYDWARLSEALDERGVRPLAVLTDGQNVRELCGYVRRRRALPPRNPHGAPRVRPRHVQIFQLPAAGPARRPAHGVLCAAGAGANHWNERLGIDHKYPAKHAAFLKQCHAAGQVRPTPLLLEYGPGDYNCLHQDLYGELAFSLQVAVLLSDPAKNFTGGEFILTEQRPRRQSRAEVVPLSQGDAVIFANNQRPAEGARGPYRVTMRHGVSRLHTGHRHTLGLIFHDAL